MNVYGNGVTVPSVLELYFIVDDGDGDLFAVNEFTGTLSFLPGDTILRSSAVSINGGALGDISLLGYTPGVSDWVWFDSIALTTPIPECFADADCDDGSFCNGTETCVNGQCVAGVNPCADGELCSDDFEVCAECFADADCDDGSFCNGVELCNNGQCDAGTNPCDADESCNETTEQCEVVMCMEGGDCSFGSVCYAEVGDVGSVCTTDEPAKPWDTLFIAGGGWWQFPKYASHANRFVFRSEWRIAMAFDEDTRPATNLLRAF